VLWGLTQAATLDPRVGNPATAKRVADSSRRGLGGAEWHGWLGEPPERGRVMRGRVDRLERPHRSSPADDAKCASDGGTYGKDELSKEGVS
jgi:hypothetical protein